MPTPENCASYKHCGFVKWLVSKDNTFSVFKYGQDCGKEIIKPNVCGRLNTHVLFKVSDLGPQSDEEIKIAFPPREFDKNGKPTKRIPSSGTR